MFTSRWFKTNTTLQSSTVPPALQHSNLQLGNSKAKSINQGSWVETSWDSWVTFSQMSVLFSHVFLHSPASLDTGSRERPFSHVLPTSINRTGHPLEMPRIPPRLGGFQSFTTNKSRWSQQKCFRRQSRTDQSNHLKTERTTSPVDHHRLAHVPPPPSSKVSRAAPIWGMWWSLETPKGCI